MSLWATCTLWIGLNTLMDILWSYCVFCFFLVGVPVQQNSQCRSPWQQLDNAARFRLRGRHDPTCFAASTVAMTYENARANCTDQFGTLAAIKEETARRFLSNLLNSNVVRSDRVYIGRIFFLQPQNWSAADWLIQSFGDFLFTVTGGLCAFTKDVNRRNKLDFWNMTIVAEKWTA